jgi:hypothetical protein
VIPSSDGGSMQIRGSALSCAQSEIRDLIRERGITPQALLRHLSAEDLTYLDQPIYESRWYPIRIHDRIAMALCELAGRESQRFLVERGRVLGRLLLASPVHRIVEEARAGLAPSSTWWGHAGAGLVTLPSALFSHSSWVLAPEDEPGRFTVEVTDADELPESSRHSVQGALETIARELVGTEVEVASERTDRARLLFHARPVR